MTVRELDAETVERIAAGEVITRPSRVVAELVENSLDAGATRIEVDIEGDGTDLIRVADDGEGMAREDAALAVERHTTSKIADAADLRRTDSLGFRGEALPSIAEAGRLELVTSDGGAVGTRVVVDDGTDITEAGRGQGTTVTVRDLFADRPARRESLAGPATEFGRASDVVSGYALVRPDVAFVLSHDGSRTFSTPGTGEFADAAASVYGREVAARSTTFEHESAFPPGAGDDGGGDADGGDRGRHVDGGEELRDEVLRVEGLLAYPSTTRASREHVHVAVNGRLVPDGDVRRAVLAGYGSLLPDGRYPVAVVCLSVPSSAVDQNVHPAKEAVAFRDADAVADGVEGAVADALTTADLRRAGEVAMDLESSLRPVEGADSAFADADVVGQYRGTYLLCDAGDELLVVDQHAAHERVNYERLRAAVAGGTGPVGGDPDSGDHHGDGGRREGDDREGVPTVRVDPPETLSLTPGEVAAVEANAGTLAALGFDVEPFGGGTVKLSGAPAPLGRAADADALRETLDALGAGERPGDIRDDLLADLACHPSLKAGDDLEADEAARLLDRLGQCEQPFACPHGRPTVLSVEAASLARGFERES